MTLVFDKKFITFTMDFSFFFERFLKGIVVNKWEITIRIV